MTTKYLATDAWGLLAWPHAKSLAPIPLPCQLPACTEHSAHHPSGTQQFIGVHAGRRGQARNHHLDPQTATAPSASSY